MPESIGREKLVVWTMYLYAFVGRSILASECIWQATVQKCLHPSGINVNVGNCSSVSARTGNDRHESHNDDHNDHENQDHQDYDPDGHLWDHPQRSLY